MEISILVNDIIGMNGKCFLFCFVLLCFSDLFIYLSIYLFIYFSTDMVQVSCQNSFGKAVFRGEVQLCTIGSQKYLSIIGKRKTNCSYPINFMAGTCEESTFSFLPVVSSYDVVVLFIKVFSS